jgi:hypothetical protein
MKESFDYVSAVHTILVPLITKKKEFRILKGPDNHPTFKQKYIGICGLSFCYTGDVVLTDDIMTSHFSIDTIDKFEDPLEALKQIVLGTADIRISKGASNSNFSDGKYLGLCSVGPCGVDASMTDDLEFSRFRLRVDGIQRDDDIMYAIYQVFSGARNVRITKALGNNDRAGASFLGLCGFGECRSLDLGLSDDADASQLRFQAVDLINIQCCLGTINDVVTCGLYYNNPKDCDPIIKELCKADETKYSDECSCINTKAPFPECYDLRCKKKGYKLIDQRNSFFCDPSFNECSTLRELETKKDNTIDVNAVDNACLNQRKETFFEYLVRTNFLYLVIFGVILGLWILSEAIFLVYKHKLLYSKPTIINAPLYTGII